MSEGDLPEAEILEMMMEVCVAGDYAYIKWTCPKCSERCVADDPNVFYTGGFRHDDQADGAKCGEVYTGPTYGLLVVLKKVRGGDQVDC